MPLNSFLGTWYVYKVSLDSAVFGRRETKMMIGEGDDPGTLSVQIDAKSGERKLSAWFVDTTGSEIKGRVGKLRLRCCLVLSRDMTRPFLFGHLSHTGDILRRDVFAAFRDQLTEPGAFFPHDEDLDGFVLPLDYPPQVEAPSKGLRPIKARIVSGALEITEIEDEEDPTKKRYTETLLIKSKSKGQRFKGGFINSGSVKDYFVGRTLPGFAGSHFKIAIGFSHYHETKPPGTDGWVVVNLGSPNCTDPTVIVYPPPPPLPEGEEERRREP